MKTKGSSLVRKILGVGIGVALILAGLVVFYIAFTKRNVTSYPHAPQILGGITGGLTIMTLFVLVGVTIIIIRP
jgi:hypothetical protein